MGFPDRLISLSFLIERALLLLYIIDAILYVSPITGFLCARFQSSVCHTHTECGNVRSHTHTRLQRARWR